MDLCKAVILEHQSLWHALWDHCRSCSEPASGHPCSDQPDQTTPCLSISGLCFILFFSLLHHEQICLLLTNLILHHKQTQIFITSFIFLSPSAIVTQTAYYLVTLKSLGSGLALSPLCSPYFLQSAVSVVDQSSQWWSQPNNSSLSPV